MFLLYMNLYSKCKYVGVSVRFSIHFLGLILLTRLSFYRNIKNQDEFNLS